MDRTHLKCTLWKVLWGISALSIIAAWVSIKLATGGQPPVFGLDALFWFWNALLFGMLSIPIKMDCQSCAVCQAR